ncbi:MAG: hypothetical protein RMM17_12795 [Acidobacteriota bacterium]|nr:hypothetical protein [Blastocatellia bacterium]MDW8413545.1 hypothetical protein [Acidobacteriota bacterium]
MSDHQMHEGHEHEHSSGCGHVAVRHGDHIDYVHDGHLHYLHEGHCDEHNLEVSEANPSACTSGHSCDGHEAGHEHSSKCGHEAVPHGDHTDYIVAGHLHHPHDGHCDDHGKVEIV